MEVAELSLRDLEVRYKRIREEFSDVEKCSVPGCCNPRDCTPSLGWDTCCAYHRLLFDYWSCDVVEDVTKLTRGERRAAFDEWLHSTGKCELDKIVLRMMAEPINWEC